MAATQVSGRQLVRPHPAVRRVRAIVDELQGTTATVHEQQCAQQHSALTGDHVQIGSASVLRRGLRNGHLFLIAGMAMFNGKP
jgi:hypothetical protein